MKALLLTVGSQGDVQPFVALAVRLRAGGHQAVLAAPAAFSGLASAYDVPFAPLELDVGQVGEAVAGRYGLQHLLAGRHGSEDNLLARLAASQAGAGQENQEEQLGMAVLLFGAGFDSPASMVGLGTKLLLEHPRQAWMLAEDDELAPNAVAEILRYEPPVQLVARTALEPVELAGTMVEPGSMILGLVAAANRDPAQVKEPEVFDVARDKSPALSFGAGPHYCLGAHLAGLQGEALFPRLLRRFPRMRLAGPPVYRSPGSTLRGLESLPLYLE